MYWESNGKPLWNSSASFKRSISVLSFHILMHKSDCICCYHRNISSIYWHVCWWYITFEAFRFTQYFMVILKILTLHLVTSTFSFFNKSNCSSFIWTIDKISQNPNAYIFCEAGSLFSEFATCAIESVSYWNETNLQIYLRLIFRMCWMILDFLSSVCLL